MKLIVDILHGFLEENEYILGTPEYNRDTQIIWARKKGGEWSSFIGLRLWSNKSSIQVIVPERTVDDARDSDNVVWRHRQIFQLPDPNFFPDLLNYLKRIDGN